MNKQKQFQRQNEFNKSNYDHFNLMLPKGDKEKLKHYAKEYDVSLNALINTAITRYIEELHKN